MKKLFAVSILLFVFLCTFAHAPSRIDVQFDDAMQNISISVEHSVPMPAVHYIDLITIKVNGNEIIKQNFTNQLNKIEQKAVYFLPNLRDGDKISVTAYCNISGKSSVDYIISLPKKEEK